MLKRFWAALLIAVLLPISASAVSVRVVWIWNDVQDFNSLRPTSVPVTVSSSSDSLVVEDSDIHEIQGNTVTFLQAPLPASYSTTSYTFTTGDLITCVFINTHLVTSASVSLSNTLHPHDPPASLSITKTADVADATDVFYFSVSLPSTYPFTTSSGVSGDTSSLIPLHAGETAVITSIPVGTAFSVHEIEDPRYTSSGDVSGIIESGGSEVEIQNTLITTSFSVKKIWQGTDKGAIELQLYADGEPVQAVFSHSGSDAPVASGGDTSTTYTATSLPKYNKDGSEIIYSATETMFRGYVTMYLNVGPYAKYTKAIYNGGTIINREVTEIRIKKEWIGVEGTPSFQLYQNGKAIEWNDVEKDGDWYRWKNLPKYRDGRLAVYTVKEKHMPGYHAIYPDDRDYAVNGETIVNYWFPTTGDDGHPFIYLVIAVAAIIALLRRR